MQWQQASSTLGVLPHCLPANPGGPADRGRVREQGLPAQEAAWLLFRTRCPPRPPDTGMLESLRRQSHLSRACRPPPARLPLPLAWGCPRPLR